MGSKFQRANSLRSDAPFVPADAALIALQKGELARAEKECLRILKRQPLHPVARQIIGIVAFESGRYEDAIDHFEQVVNCYPQDADGFNNLGRVLSQVGRTQEAIVRLERAIALNPLLADAFCNLGGALHAEGQISRAIEANLRANQLNPRSAYPLINLASLLAECGRLSESMDLYDRIIAMDPRSSIAWSNRLMTMQYSSSYDNRDLLEAAVKWGDTQVAPRYQFDTALNHERIRIGYVSGDLYAHPLGYVMEQVLGKHDRSRFEIFCYANQPRVDEVTARARENADHWHFLAGMSDDAAADLIHSHEIDILVDLSGHTALNRLGVFARKPAPIQATWLGYFGTTGLKQMDYILRDPAQIPADERAYYTESIFELGSGAFGFTPPKDCPSVSSLPAAKNGYVTFACFNNVTKMTREVLRTWAELMRAIPTSRLVLARKPFGDLGISEPFKGKLAELGVEPSRITTLATRGHAAYLELYRKVDIILDTYPFNGGTTTYEALWMGCPVVAHRWDRMVGHFAESILSPCGFPHWVANSEAEYVGIALRLASDLDELTRLRKSLRNKLAKSELCNTGECVRQLELAYDRMVMNYQAQELKCA